MLTMGFPGGFLLLGSKASSSERETQKTSSRDFGCCNSPISCSGEYSKSSQCL